MCALLDDDDLTQLETARESKSEAGGERAAIDAAEAGPERGRHKPLSIRDATRAYTTTGPSSCPSPEARGLDGGRLKPTARAEERRLPCFPKLELLHADLSGGVVGIVFVGDVP